MFSHPPYIRWLAAAAVIAAALAWDMSGRSTEPYPFAIESIPAGTRLSEAEIEWREVPTGSLISPDVDTTAALVDIASGDPITPSVAGEPLRVPDGWWAVPMRLPPHLAPGDAVRLVLPDGTTLDAVVSTRATVDEFGSDSIGAVAVPDDRAALVAAASASNAVLVLARP